MRFSSFIAAASLVGLFFGLGPIGISDLGAQTVQLPTFRMFSVSGTVSVPDGGAMSMGGVKRSSEGAVTRGLPLLSNLPGANRLFKNRAIGRETSSQNMVATAQIIILEELEQEVLAEAERRRAAAGGVNEEVRQKAAFLSKHVGKGSSTSNQSRYGKKR